MAATEDAPLVRISRPRAHVGLLTIDRPSRHNALNLAVKRELETGLRELSSDADLRAIVLTGSSSVFVAGTDLGEMATMTAADHARLGTNDVWLALRACEKPLIAAVEGYALGGGCELALSCDIVVLAQSAMLGQPEIRVGIMPGAGGTQYLVRAIGRYRAARLTMTGELITGKEAAEMGLASLLVNDGQALRSAMDLAEGVAAMPGASINAIKRALRAGLDTGLNEGLQIERESFVDLFGSADQREGMQAFLEKRPPRFNEPPASSLIDASDG